MPELPEVETIARQLQGLVVGRTVSGFSSLWHRVTEPHTARNFRSRLLGRRITGVGRRGKFVVLELDGGEALIVSLRMTGQLLFREAGSAEDRFTRAFLTFADGSFLRFADTRKFGRMQIVDVGDLADDVRERRAVGKPLHVSLGIEPLSRRFTVRWLAAAVVVQAIGLGLLGLTLNNRGDNHKNYETVATAEKRLHAPAVSLAFAPQTSIGTVNTLLTHQGLSLVGGPGGAGNYRAELSSDAVASGATAESVAAVLSKDPNVTFAEPIAK